MDVDRLFWQLICVLYQAYIQNLHGNITNSLVQNIRLQIYVCMHHSPYIIIYKHFFFCIFGFYIIPFNNLRIRLGSTAHQPKQNLKWPKPDPTSITKPKDKKSPKKTETLDLKTDAPSPPSEKRVLLQENSGSTNADQSQRRYRPFLRT